MGFLWNYFFQLFEKKIDDKKNLSSIKKIKKTPHQTHKLEQPGYLDKPTIHTNYI
jgi:hypothetical protein